MFKARILSATLPALLCCAGCSDSADPMMQGGLTPTPNETAGTGATAGTSAPPPGAGGAAGTMATPTAGTTGSGQPPGDQPVAGQAPGDTPTAASDPTTPFEMLPDNCKGFEVRGLTHSPGGDTLPNTCAPFHNVRNNPYAIRCIDADPAYSTGWSGDEWCILPPEPSLGMQIAVSPADYANPESGFVLDPGSETTQNYYKNSDNAEQRYFYRVNLRMRTGSHHIINSLIADRPDGWTSERDTGLDEKGFLGAQRPDADRPMTREVPPENAGHGDVLEANQQFQFNMHHFNFTEEPLLREVWANIWWKPESEVTEELGGIGIFGNPADINIRPGEHRELEYTCNVTGNTRIVTLNGHRHASTTRFGVWIEREGGGIESVYESFDYNDMPTYAYDSVAMNPVPDVATKTDGASSGVLTVSPGDKIHFVCDITNDIPSNVENNVTLNFGNEVLTGEMCILFGSHTGDPLCGFIL